MFKEVVVGDDIIASDCCVIWVNPTAVHPVTRGCRLLDVATAENEPTKAFDVLLSSAAKPRATARRIFLVIIIARIVSSV